MREYCKISGKVIYRSERSARGELNALRSRKEGRGFRIRGDKRPSRVYRCEHCECWHLTSQDD